MRIHLFVLPLLLLGCKKKEVAPTTTTDDGNVDADELMIDVSDPEPASYHPPGSYEVAGEQVGLSNLTLDDEPVDQVLGETFAHEIELVRGVNTFEVRGEKGSTFRMVRESVMAGSFGEPAGLIDDAVGIRLNQGGLDALGGMVGGLVDDVTLTKLITGLNPVYESFVADVAVGAIYFDPLQVDLQPRAGELEVEIELPNAEIWLLVDTLIDFDLWVTMDSARMTAGLDLGTDGNGHLTAGLADPTVELVNFEYDTSLIPGDSLALFDGTIQGVLEDVLLEQLETLVPPLLEDQLGSLELAFDLDLLGTPVSIASEFAHASVDPNGVQLVADLDVDVDSNGTKLAPGYLLADAGMPTPNTRDDLTVALSDDLVNRVLYEVWSGGVLDLTLSTEDGSLPSSYLESFGTDTGTLSIDAQMPPVLVQKGAETELQVGEMLLHLSTPSNQTFTYIDLALALKIPVDLEVEDGALDIALGSPDLQFVVRDTDWGNVNEEWLTGLLEEELPIESLLLVLGAISFDLPSIAGISLENASIDRDPSQVFTNIAADL